MRCFVKNNNVLEKKLVWGPQFIKIFHQGCVIYKRLRNTELDFMKKLYSMVFVVSINTFLKFLVKNKLLTDSSQQIQLVTIF
jgi:hypothetical protein